MKTTLLILALSTVALCAQTPAPVSEELAATRPGAVAPTNATSDEGTPSAPVVGLIAPVGKPTMTVTTPPPRGSGRATINGTPSPAAPSAHKPGVQPGPAARIAAAAPAAPEQEKEVYAPGQIDFSAAELNQVLKIYAELVNRTILRSPGLAAQPITLKTQTPLTKTEAISVLNALLAMNGVAMINIGDKFVKAVPTAQADMQGAAFSKITSADDLPDLGQYVTHVVQLHYTKPSEVVPVLQAFGNTKSILPVESSQIIVIRDYAENVKRMLEMLEKIDTTVPSEFVNEVIPIKYALAADISSALNSLSGSGSSGTSVGRSGAPTPAVNSTRQGGLASPGSTQGQNQYRQPGQAQAGGTGTPSGGGTFSDRLQSIIRRASNSSGDLQILGTTKIISDERTNSLLIFATREDMKTIKDIVAKLDVVLAQVLIETVIMDVNLGNTHDIGVSAAQSKKNLSTGVSTIGGYRNGTPFFDAIANATNSFPGNLPSGFGYFAKLNQGWDVALTAIDTDNRINIIQKPRILTSHATPASVFIGGTVPYISSTYYGGGIGGAPTSSYQQLSIGIGLDVTPFINPDGLVVMKVAETIDEEGEGVPIDGNKVPRTTSRRFNAEVAVRDGDSVILGGFIRNKDSKSASGVPYLKDLPIFGTFFRSKSNVKDRTELVVLMRPTVLRTPELAAIRSDKEKNKLPGVVHAEREYNTYEERTLLKEQERVFNRPVPFTDAEIKEYGTPAEGKGSPKPEPVFAPLPEEPTGSLQPDAPAANP